MLTRTRTSVECVRVERAVCNRNEILITLPNDKSLKLAK